MVVKGLLIALFAITFLIGPVIHAPSLRELSFVNWFVSPQQLGTWWYQRGQYAKAAESFSDNFAKAAAYYRNGDFKQAAQYFGYVNGPDGLYNRGNALLMGGQYDLAINCYQQALTFKSDWLQAEQNLAIAKARAEIIKREGGEGTDGKLGADEVVFDGNPSPASQNTTTEQVAEAGLSEAEQQAMWLRRIQTKPADFLRVKFQFQESLGTIQSDEALSQ